MPNRIDVVVTYDVNTLTKEDAAPAPGCQGVRGFVPTRAVVRLRMPSH